MAKAVKEFKYQLTLADRDEQLFNNEYLSDIVFSVGNGGQRFYGHKLILTLASEVFYAQFNGQFKEAQRNERPVVVTDIEPPIFRDILRYMYCHKIDITQENVIEVYYASQKYLLTGVNEKCEQFFACKLDEKNVLEVFNKNRKHEFAFVNKSCLAVIQDNPLACFQQKAFLTIESKTLEMIAGSTSINCSPEQLCEAIKTWTKVDDKRSRDAYPLTRIVLDEQHRKQDSLGFHNFQRWIFFSSITTFLQIQNYRSNPIGLYGLGIFVKSQSQPTADAKLKVKMEIEYSGPRGLLRKFTVEKDVAFTIELRTEEFFFEKLIIDCSHYCKISVNIVKLSASPDMFCLNTFESIDNTLNISKDSNRNSNGNCVAYFLYKNVTVKDENKK